MAKGFKKLQADINASVSANKADRMGDFRFEQRGVDAIYGNLATTGKGLGKTLTKEQVRSLQAMKRIQQKALKPIGPSAASVKNQYGTALGSSINQQFNVAESIQGATKTETKAAVKAGITTAAGGKLAMKTMSAGVKEAKAGADYALAAALRYRAGQDASLQSEQQLALDTMKLQSKLDWDMWKKQQDYQQKLDNKASDKSLSQVTDLAPDAGQYIAQWSASHPDATPAAMAAAYVNYAGVAPGSPEASLATVIARKVAAGQGAVDATTSAISTLYGDSKAYDAASIQDTVQAGVRAGNSSAITSLMGKEDRSDAENDQLAYLLAQRGLSAEEAMRVSGSDSSNPNLLSQLVQLSGLMMNPGALGSFIQQSLTH